MIGTKVKDMTVKINTLAQLINDKNKYTENMILEGKYVLSFNNFCIEHDLDKKFADYHKELEYMISNNFEEISIRGFKKRLQKMYEREYENYISELFKK